MNQATEGRSAPSVVSRTAPHGKAARRYLVAAFGCGAFAFIYAQFSHGVYSPFMTFMFAIPLIGGALPALVAHLAHLAPAPRAARQAWALALASLTVASCLRGIFDIAGTASPFLPVYLVAAALFAIAAVAVVIRKPPAGGRTSGVDGVGEEVR